MDITLVRRKNLKKAIDELIKIGLYKNSADFCEKVDIEQAYISQILNGHRNLGEKSARKIEEKMGVAQFSLDRFSSNVIDETANPVHKIPVITLEHAKDWSRYVSGEYESLGFTTSDYIGERPEEIFCVLIADPSMESKFQKGDKIIVDPYAQPEPSDFVVAEIDDQYIVFKRYRVISYASSKEVVFELVSLNSDFPKIQSDTSTIRIIGVAMIHIQDLRDWS